LVQYHCNLAMFSMICFLLPLLAAGATLQSERSSEISVMRRETQVQFGARGDMRPAKQGEDPPNFCSKYFPVGTTDGTFACTDPTHEHMMRESDMCEDAARRACPKTNSSCEGNQCHSCFGIPFVLEHHCVDGPTCLVTEYQKYPKGCFMNEDTPPKWHYNPTGEVQGVAPLASGEYTPLVGTTVCYVEQYKYGTTDSNACGDALYSNIADEDNCRLTAGCLGDGPDEVEWRIYNTSARYDTVPTGCHVGTDGKTRFNENPAPSAPVGKAVCQLIAAIPAAGSALAPLAGATAATATAAPTAAP